jgi:hypothetical protein
MPTGQPTSKAYLHDIDLVRNQLLNAKLHPVQSSARTALGSSLNSNDEGLLVYDTTLDQFYVWDGNQWRVVGLTEGDAEWLADAYDKSVMGIVITQSGTERTVTLNRRDSTSISDTYKFSHVHTQTVPALEWTVTHNLGKYPSVSIVDSAEEEVIGEVEYVDTNSLIVKFTAAFSGKAFIN